MAKRGRKPKEKKAYFCEDEEQAIVRYIEEDDIIVKNKIFNDVLYPALTKMIESIIRRYKLFVPDEEFEDNFSDTISYLITKINHFKSTIVGYDEIENVEDMDPLYFEEMSVDEFKEKVRNALDTDPDYIMVGDEFKVKYYKKVEHKYKAYSYCGTVCKNYLMFKCSRYAKKKQNHLSYDDVYDEISNNLKFSINESDDYDFTEQLICEISDEIENMVNDGSNLDDDEITVGMALINLLRNWEEVLPNSGSNKLQKSKVLYFLREETMMTTKEVRDNMKKFKSMYYLLRRAHLEN